jgi:hypothetical protein
MNTNWFATACAVASLAATPVGAQPATAQAASPTPTASNAPEAAPPAPVVKVKVLEGTEFPLRLEDSLSSKTAQVGDRFTVSLDDDIKLSDGTVLRAGYRGVGAVVAAQKNGAMGRTGKLSILINYLKVGDQRIRLRGTRAAEGDHRTGTQVATVILVGVFAGFVKGKNIEIIKGTRLNAFTDQDIVLDGPLPPPPSSPDV